jgi:hypothetical protein
MASVRVTWQGQTTEFPPGTKPAWAFVVHLGTLTATVPLGTFEATFADVPPGQYPSSVEVVAADGTVLAAGTGNVLTVPAPVLVPVPSQVLAALI